MHPTFFETDPLKSWGGGLSIGPTATDCDKISHTTRKNTALPRYPPLDLNSYTRKVLACKRRNNGYGSRFFKVASLPFRFKAGGDAKMPGAVATGHSHRPTTKATNKGFKSRKATKGAIRDAAKGESRRTR